MVLTHLILNGVIKIKNNGGLLALAVIDDDTRISEFSRQFFIKVSAGRADSTPFSHVS